MRLELAYIKSASQTDHRRVCRTIAEDGNETTDIIVLAPLRRSSESGALKMRGSRGVYHFDQHNAEYTLRARVPYFCESYREAQLKLFELAEMLDDAQEGEFSVCEDGKTLLKFCDAVISAEFPDEIFGCFFEVEYEIKGSFPRRMQETAPKVSGCAVCVGGSILTINSLYQWQS